MSNSVWPHRWQPTRLPCPWDSPGKSTGVGCHFLLQCMKVKSESEVTQSCPTPTFLRCPHTAQWPITCPEMLLASTVFFLDLDEQTHHRTWYLTSEMVAKRAWCCNMDVQGNYFPTVQLQPVGNRRMGELRRYNAFLSFFHGWLLRPSACLGWVTCSAPLHGSL